MSTIIPQYTYNNPVTYSTADNSILTYSTADNSILTYSTIFDKTYINLCDLNLSDITILTLLNDPNMGDNNKKEYVKSLIKNTGLEESFIEKIYKYADPCSVFKYHNLSLGFINKHLEGNLKSILLYQKVPTSFIDDHKNDDDFSWSNIFMNKTIQLSANYVIKNLKSILKEYNHYINDNTLTTFNSGLFVTNITTSTNPEIFIDTAVNKLLKNYNANNEDYNKVLKVLINKYIDDIDYDYLSWQRYLTEDNIEVIIDRLDFNSPLLKNRTYKNPSIECYNRV